MKSVNIRLTDPELRLLGDVAIRERRDPSRQAALYVAKALRRARPIETSTPAPRPAVENRTP